MKKSIILLAASILTLGFSACEDDKEPVYTPPTQFVLNIPPLANSEYVLGEGGIIDLTVSQPDYGYSAITNYEVDLTIDDSFVEESEGTPANYQTLSPVNPTSARIELKDQEVSKAILALQDITTYTGFNDADDAGLITAKKVLVRVRASLKGIQGSEITSNTVTLAAVMPYNCFPAVPRFVYLVGNPSGWKEPSKDNEEYYKGKNDLGPDGTGLNFSIEETGVGTDIYEGSVYIPAGQQYFRFYLGLDGWGSDNELPSFGPFGVDGTNKAIDITAASQTIDAVPGKGSWFTSEKWAGNDVFFSIDMTKPADGIKITYKIGGYVKEYYVYLVGSQAGWAEPNTDNKSVYDNWRLVDVGGTGIYEATFTIPAGDMYFRVYGELSGWGPTPYSSAADGSNVNIVSGTAYKCEVGEGCWVYPATGGDLTFTLDTTVDPATMTVTAQ